MGGLVKKQNEFLKDVVKLLQWCDDNGYVVTFGEAYRTADQQLLYFYGASLRDKGDGVEVVYSDRRLSKVKKGRHNVRLAVDLNFFKDGKYLTTLADIEPIGNRWESLSDDNVWGGRWGWDAGHFQKGKT